MPATPAYLNYGSVTNSAYNNFMNGGGNPINYSRPSNSIRPRGDAVNINTNSNPDDRQQRIDSMVNRALEQFDAQTAIRQGIQQRWDADYNATVRPVQQQLQQSFYGPELNRSTYGGNASSDAYSRFMNSQSGDALFGGTRTTPEQRYSSWNNEIGRRQQLAYQTLAPLWQKYGMNPTPYGPQAFRM